MIAWISVSDRVPDNRRKVLAWGWSRGVLFCKRKMAFLGVTRYNMDRTGGRFDLEEPSPWGYSRVSHWAEIEGPEEDGQ